MSSPLYVTVTPTVITTAYSANTVVGGLQTLNGLPPRGLIRDIIAFIDGTITPALDLYFFRSLPATIADNATFAPSYADQTKLIPTDKLSIASGDYVTLNSKTRAPKNGINKDFVSAPNGNNGNSLYLFIVNPATPTFPSATALTLLLSIWDLDD